MGKPEEQHQLGNHQAEIAAGEPDILRRCAAIARAFTPRCVVVLLLSVCVLLSVFWLPPLCNSRSGFDSDDVDHLSAEIQACFILQKPLSLVVAHVSRLEYEILEEIGVPNTKVSVTSIHPLAETNSTYVAFAVFPDSKYTSISLPALSVLRSSLIELVLQQLNLSLTPSYFGQPSSFEVLKFPGGITVIPMQSASIWEITQFLFNFKLNNSIIQIQKNLEELKNQLKFGLNLRSYENVYVLMTNVNGSTVAPPVTVQASVLSDFGSRSLLPNRLKQLAQVITGPHAKNLGLNHSVFGKVKEIELSSYLQHSISSQESPSPSPSPSPLQEPPYTAPHLPSYPSLSPSYAPVPSIDRRHQPPCLSCDTFSPTGSPLSYAPGPKNGPQPPSQSFNSPGPSIANIAPSRRRPCFSHSRPPNASPIYHPHPPTSTDYAPNSAIPPKYKPWGPASQMAPQLSPLSPAGTYSSSPLQGKGSGKASTPSISTSPPISPSPISHSAAHSNYGDPWLIGWLLGFLTFQLLLKLLLPAILILCCCW